MPKRVLDFDALWGSDKLASCAGWAQAEYAWLYGLADASGCFELTNLRVIWGRVAAIRQDLTIERLGQVFAEFQDRGLLFVWEHEGKRYAHWTGSDVPGRLPAPSWRMRLERFAPPVPKQELAAYMARFSRGRAAMAGAGFRGDARAGAGTTVNGGKAEVAESRERRGGDGSLCDAQLRDSRVLVGNGEENYRLENSESGRDRERRDGDGRFCDAQLTDSRLLVGKGEENYRSDNSESGRDRERRGGTVNLRHGERATAPAEASETPGEMPRNEMADQGRDCVGGAGHQGGLEEAQAQDLDWNRNWKKSWNENLGAAGEQERCNPRATAGQAGRARPEQEIKPTDFSDLSATAKANSKTNSRVSAKATSTTTAGAAANSRSGWRSEPRSEARSDPRSEPRSDTRSESRSVPRSETASPESLESRTGQNEKFDARTLIRPVIAAHAARDAKTFSWRDRYREKELSVERELRVGQGPVCGPMGISKEALERIRKREEVRAAARSR